MGGSGIRRLRKDGPAFAHAASRICGQGGMCRSKACMQSKGNVIWPYVLGMNMKNAFKCVLYFFTVINRYIFTFHVLAFL